ncbi:MAG: hypothetical protein LBC97_13795 [Bifidobacteriaceae bacterium]|jgi:hypothetical protein|nr:hypothetical protein [Bifidobacteriaceae bacterium]
MTDQAGARDLRRGYATPAPARTRPGGIGGGGGGVPPELNTEAMMNRLKEDFAAFPGGDEAGFLDADIRDFFNELFRGCPLTRSEVIREANISRTYGYQIMDGTRIGKRDYYLAIGFAMGLNLKQTQRMLAVTATGALHPLIKRDAAIIFGLNHGYDNNKLYWFLTELGLPPLNTGVEGA